MLNVKRAIIKKLLADILGRAAEPSSITLFEDLIKFTSTSYLASFKKSFIAALDTKAGNLLYKPEHFNLDKFKKKLTQIYTDTNVDMSGPLKTNFTRARDERNIKLSYDESQKLNRTGLITDEAIKAANLIKDSAGELSKMSGLGISEGDRKILDATISKITDATTAEGTFSAMGLENDEAYLVGSKSDAIEAILTEAGLPTNTIKLIMNQVKQDETLNKNLIEQLILSNKTMENATEVLKTKNKK